MMGYTLWLANTLLLKITLFNRDIKYKWQFSIVAVLNNQRAQTTETDCFYHVVHLVDPQFPVWEYGAVWIPIAD